MVNWKTIQAAVGDDPPTATFSYGTHVLDGLADLPENSVDAIITEPPRWQKAELNTTGISSQSWPSFTYNPMNDVGKIGVPDGKCHHGAELECRDFIGHQIWVWRQAMRVLKPNGSLWVLLKDSRTGMTRIRDTENDLVKKNVVGIPYRFALAMQAEGWLWRSAPVWYESNRLPSMPYRAPTDVHHHLFFAAHPKSKGIYHYDVDAIREPHTHQHAPPGNKTAEVADGFANRPLGDAAFHKNGRNKRSVFDVTHKCYGGVQEGPWPPELVEIMVKASVPHGGTVLDPFAGSGVTAAVALAHGRNFIGIDVNPNAEDEIRRRVLNTKPIRKSTLRSEQPNVVTRMFLDEGNGLDSEA
jgi:site-specific DNA-methyltransferase (adenine-specific)